MSSGISTSSIRVQQKCCTFRCEWTTSTYNTKSEDFALEYSGHPLFGGKSCCIAVKYVQRLSRYVLFFVNRCRFQPGYEITEVFITTHPAATRVPMTATAVDGARIFSYELQEWKTPVTSVFWVSITETIPNYSFRPCDILASEQLWKAAEDGLFADIRFEVGSRTFPAHKAIVAARSPVLMAMFKSDMSESRTNCVQVNDCDPTVFGLFLSFVYTGRLEEALTACQREELYTIADKYQVDTLKSLCQSSGNELDASDLSSLIISL